MMSGKFLKDNGIRIITFKSDEERENFAELYLNDLGAIEYCYDEVENFNEGCKEYNLELVE